MALLTGMRLSELCALSWNNVEINNKLIHVCESTRRIKKGNNTIVIIDTPKSDTSIRSIPITNYISNILKKLNTLNSYYVFPKKNGERYDNRSIQKYFGLVIKELGFKNKTFHTLRHTFATTAIESGMDIKTLSIILGHSSVSITMDLYVHPNEQHMRKAMENVFSKILIK